MSLSKKHNTFVTIKKSKTSWCKVINTITNVQWICPIRDNISFMPSEYKCSLYTYDNRIQRILMLPCWVRYVDEEMSNDNGRWVLYRGALVFTIRFAFLTRRPFMTQRNVFRRIKNTRSKSNNYYLTVELNAPNHITTKDNGTDGLTYTLFCQQENKMLDVDR